MSVVNSQSAEFNLHSSENSFTPLSHQLVFENDKTERSVYDSCPSHPEYESVSSFSRQHIADDTNMDEKPGTPCAQSLPGVVHLQHQNTYDKLGELNTIESETKTTVHEAISVQSALDESDGLNLKQTTEQTSSMDEHGYPIPLSIIKTKSLPIEIEAHESKEKVNANEERLMNSESTSLISKQRDKILHIRRKDRSFDERNKINLAKDRKSFEFGSRISSNVKSKTVLLNESKNASTKKKHKKLKKRMSYDAFRDIFSEPFNVKKYSSENPAKRQQKLPSKFIYLSEMEKGMRDSSKKRAEQRKRHRLKHKHYTHSMKEDKFDQSKAVTRVNVKVDEASSEKYCPDDVKVFMMKDGKSTSVLRQQSNQKLAHRHKHLCSSYASLSVQSSKPSKILRDSSFYQHCFQRYYRLRSSNWNCSSRHALRMLKRKYNSLKLLFHSEPVVCLKRLSLRDIALKQENVTEIPDRQITVKPVKLENGLLHLKEESKPFSSAFSGRAKKIKTEPADLVDPRVMSLSKTLQSGQKGQVGLAKIFKSHNNQPAKSQYRNKPVSQKQPVQCKKKNKQDWSKWRERLKEASMRMIERKPGGQIVERNINKFPHMKLNSSPFGNSLVHFRIPLKSNSRINKAEIDLLQMTGKENTLEATDSGNTAESYSESDSIKENVTEGMDATKNDQENLAAMNEELTIEEYDSDSFVGYTINGYSIEINRESPVAEFNEEENAVVNECIDEEEMNKLLYGEHCDNETVHCYTNDYQQNHENHDAKVMLTNDGIPNLYCQEELGFREHDISDEVDMSPPVLERLSEGFCDFEIGVNVPQTDHPEGSGNSPGIDDSNGIEIEINTLNEAVNIDNEHVNKGIDIQSRVSGSCEETVSEMSESLPFVIENVCSLSENINVSQCEQINSELNDLDIEEKTDNEIEHDMDGQSELEVELYTGKGVDINSVTDNANFHEKQKIKVPDFKNEIQNTLNGISDEVETQTIPTLMCYRPQTPNEVETKAKPNMTLDCQTHIQLDKTESSGKEFVGTFTSSIRDTDTKINIPSIRLPDNINKFEERKINSVTPISEIPKVEVQRSVTVTESANRENTICADEDLPATVENNKSVCGSNGNSTESIGGSEIKKINLGNFEMKEVGVSKDNTMSKESKSYIKNANEFPDDFTNPDGNEAKTDQNTKFAILVTQTGGCNEQVSDTSSEGKRAETNDRADKCEENHNVDHDKCENHKPTDAAKGKEYLQKRKPDHEMQKNHQVEELTESERQSSGCDVNMELNEERLMRDFPNHNWLFNKYNISEVTVDTETVKDASNKGKKAKKDDKDPSKKTDGPKETKVRKKSTSLSGNMQQNPQKHLRDKTNTSNKVSPEKVTTQKETETITNHVSAEGNDEIVKADKPNIPDSHDDCGELLKKEEDLISHNRQSEVKPMDNQNTCKTEHKVLFSECKTKRDSNPSANQKNPEKSEKQTCSLATHSFGSKCKGQDISNVAIDLSIRKKDSLIGFNTGLYDAKYRQNSFDLDEVEAPPASSFKCQNQIENVKENNKNGRDIDDPTETFPATDESETVELTVRNKTETDIGGFKVSSDLLQDTLFGSIIDDDEGGDDDDDDYDEDEKKLEIDESACVDDDTEVKDISELPNSQIDLTEEENRGPEKSSERADLMSTTGCVGGDIEATKLKQIEADIADSRPEQGTETVAEAVAYEPNAGPKCEVGDLTTVEKIPEAGISIKEKAYEIEPEIDSPVSQLPEVNKPKLESADPGTVKSDAISISFRQRTKPPVQLVHPQVHKPPGKVKVEPDTTPDIQTLEASHSLENKEGTVVVTVSERLSPRISETAVSGETRIPCLNTSPNSVVHSSAVLLNGATCQVSASVLAALPSSSTNVLTTSTSSSFANGVVIPIQPFVQTVPTSHPQEYVQSGPQLQQNVVHIQPQTMDQVFQQPTPVHIQNQLIPVTFFQSGNQTVISNYTLTNQTARQEVSSQSINIIPDQPISMNVNPTRVGINSVRSAIGKTISTGPPPLLMLPKPRMTTLSQENQSLQMSSQLSPLTNTPRLAQKCADQSERSHTSTKIPEHKAIPQPCGVASINFDSVSSKQTAFNDQHNSNDTTVEDAEEDDEIKKQMDALDKEIKRKELEQEEMKRKKLALIQKMKQSKSTKASDFNRKDGDEFEIEKCDREQSNKCTIDNTQKTGICFETDVYVDLEKMSTISDSKETQMAIKRPGQNVVFSEINNEGGNDVFISTTPIDLSSSFKCKKGLGLGPDCSVSVTDGVLSIKETTKSSNLLEQVDKVLLDNIDEVKSENDQCKSEVRINKDYSRLSDNSINKNDGISYIEDIGLVNPFTGEYEINEDVEGVEYLDLSSKPGENRVVSNTMRDNEKDAKVEAKKFCSKEYESDCKPDSSEINQSCLNISVTKSEPNMNLVTDMQDHLMDKIDACSGAINKLGENPALISVANTTTNVSVTASGVSVITCSFAQDKVNDKVLTTVTAQEPLVLTTQTSPSNFDKNNSVGTDEDKNAGNFDIHEKVLNLVKARLPRVQVDTQDDSSVMKGIEKGDIISPKKSLNKQFEGGLLPRLIFQSNSQNVVPEIRPVPVCEALSGHLRAEMKVNNPCDLNDTYIRSAANVASPSLPTSRQHSGNLCSSKQTYRASVHNSRGIFRKRPKENAMELKPAHYRSPPRKIQKGAKPLPAHCQKATSRETMKRMCKTPLKHNLIDSYNTSPYIHRKQPSFLSPREIDKPFPRLWEKKMPKPAHSKRPFGIAGHLIVPMSKKRRRRTVSGETPPSPGFYSLPNTPTSPGVGPPRATSADYHGSFSPLQMPKDNQGLIGSPSASMSTPKFEVPQGVQTESPSPIKAHCRPRSHISADQFYETSVLRPPAVVRDTRYQGPVTVKEPSEIIDLTSDMIHSSAPRTDFQSGKSPNSKEQAIQNELSHAVSKRHRLEAVESLQAERNRVTNKNTAIRSKQIMNQIAKMPPPPYVGRQRMPVLLQVPRDQAAFEQTPRMPNDRRMEENPCFRERNFDFSRRHRLQRQQANQIGQESQFRPQMEWNPQQASQTQETRFTARLVQPGVPVQALNSGNEQFIPNQDMIPQRGPSQQIVYSPRDTMQYAGNPRMIHPNNVHRHPTVPQQVFPVRGQNMQFPASQNQTEIHQLLQQPRAPNTHMQRGETSPMRVIRDASPQMLQRGVTSPQMNMNGNMNSEMMQRRMSSQMTQMTGAPPPMVHTSITPMTPNVPVMQTGDMNTAILYTPGNGASMMPAGNVSPQMISPTGMMMVDQRGQVVQDASASGSPVGAHCTLTTEQRFQRMQQIRAQHIRSQQFQTRNQTVAVESPTRVPDVRNVDLTSRIVEAITNHQQVPGYHTGPSYQSAGYTNQNVQTTTFSQPMAILENQTGRNLQPLSHFHGPENGSANNNPYPSAVIQRPTVTLTTAPQSQFHPSNTRNIVPAPPKLHQNTVPANLIPVNSVQQNAFIRPSGYMTSENMQRPAIVVQNHDQSNHVHGQVLNVLPNGMAPVHKGRQIHSEGQFQGPLDIVPGNQIVQPQTNTNIHTSHDIHGGLFKNQRTNVQGTAQNNHGSSSFQPMPPTGAIMSMHGTNLDPALVTIPRNSTSHTANGHQGHIRASDGTALNLIRNTQPPAAQLQNKLTDRQGETVQEELPHLQQVHGECIMCGKYSLYLCSNCKKIWYCSPECQLTHWQTHALECEGQTG